jgi:hypothetical protein
VGYSIPITSIGFDKVLRDGVAGSVASVVGEVLDLTRAELASLLHTSTSTLDWRLVRGGRFFGAEADALCRVLGTSGSAARPKNADEHSIVAAQSATRTCRRGAARSARYPAPAPKP